MLQVPKENSNSHSSLSDRLSTGSHKLSSGLFPGYTLHMCTQGLLHLSTVDVWGQKTLYHRGLSDMLQDAQQNPWPLPTRSQQHVPPPFASDNQKCLQTLSSVHWRERQKSPHLRTDGFRLTDKKIKKREISVC